MHSNAHIADRPSHRRLPKRHVLMLALAVEVLAFGVCHADRYHRPTPIAVEAPIVPGHRIA